MCGSPTLSAKLLHHDPVALDFVQIIFSHIRTLRLPKFSSHLHLKRACR